MPQAQLTRRTLLEKKFVTGYKVFAECGRTITDHEEERQKEMMSEPKPSGGDGKTASSAALEAAFKRTQRYDAKGRSVSTPATKKS